MKIDQNKLEEASRNLGVVFASSALIGFFFEYSFIGSVFAMILGISFILFGIKESKNGN